MLSVADHIDDNRRGLEWPALRQLQATARAIVKIDRFLYDAPLEPAHVMSRTWRATIRSQSKSKRGSMLRITMKRLASLSLVAALAACGTASVAPGYYRVQRGDTVSRIAREQGQSAQSIVRWNNLPNPDAIEVGQVLRVTPPSTARARADEPRAAVNPTPRAGTAGDNTASRDSARTALGPPPAAPANGIKLIWPAHGTMVRGFNGSNSKGIDIANAAGTPVVAAAAGTVVYAGDGLRGYGNLLIVKHNADFLTAYAHNRRLLVKENQSVAQGQQIAEMGDSDNDRVALHFEVRYKGQSIDPARYLSAR
jgi:lipoprotein YgeR